MPLIEQGVKQLVDSANIPVERMLGVGVAMPGPFLSEDRNIVSPTNFPHWERVPLVEKLTELLGLPVFMENDATSAAIGEQFHGAGREYQDFFYVYFF